MDIKVNTKTIGKDKKYYLKTYGCQMNVHDSENISAIMPRAIDMTVENATTGVSVPFHPGAAKYFAENGFYAPTE